MKLLLFTFFWLAVSAFYRPGLPSLQEYPSCDCSAKSWKCFLSCPGQTLGTHETCLLEEKDGNDWKERHPIVQKGKAFCQQGMILNEKSLFAVGNYFVPESRLDINAGLSCYSLRLGDETKRQRVAFDFLTPLKNLDGPDFVIFENGNGTRDGRLDGRVYLDTPTDDYEPEAFAFSFKIDSDEGAYWTEFYYQGVLELVDELGYPLWKRLNSYDPFFDSWATVIDFSSLDVSPESSVVGISLINLQPQDLILGEDGTRGFVVFGEQKDKCTDACVEPMIPGTQKPFGETSFDPDIMWLSEYRGEIRTKF